MSAMNPILGYPDDATANATRPGHSSVGMRWTALHDTADILAVMAEMDAAELSSAEPEDVRSFPMRLRQLGEYRHAQAEQQIAELMAMLQPGVSALLTLCHRGQSPTIPAQVLLDEFCDARDRILALAPIASTAGLGLTAADFVAADRSVPFDGH